MKTHKINSKLSKVIRLENELQKALFELSGEVEKTFGEGWYSTMVTGEGVVIANQDDEMKVSPLGSIMTAIENGDFTHPYDYSV